MPPRKERQKVRGVLGRLSGRKKKERRTGTKLEAGKGSGSSLKKLKKELDSTFSEYIRNKYSNDSGICSCVTCGKKGSWREFHAGHFVSRTYLKTRWDEHNVHPQCVGCNIFKKGNMDEYAKFILWKYGRGEFDRLLEWKNIQVKMSRSDYEERIKEYGDKLSALRRGGAALC